MVWQGKKLQESLNRLEETSPGRDGHVFDQITIVKQGDKIRAIECSPGKESAVRDMAALPGFSSPGTDVSTVSPDSITREQIVLTAEGEKH